jgi:hypothetical protein
MITLTVEARQPSRDAWPMDRLIHERSINLGLALDQSTNQTYSSALNSYVTFCDLHHLSLDPTPDTLSLFVTYMSAHINPRSVDNYLSGISSVLEEYYPHVRQSRRSRLVSRTLKGAKRRFGVPIHRKLPLSRSDLANAQSALSSTLSHDDHLFLAILFDGFYGLLRLGELVWPDSRRLQSIDKVTLRTSVLVMPSYHSFVLPRHKSDSQFEGSTIVVQRAESADPHGTFTSYLASRDHLFPFNSFLWLRSDGSIPTRSWFIGRLRSQFPNTISGHSLRAGGATSLAASEVPFDRIQAMGRWSSDAFRIYVRKNPALLHALVFNGRSIHDSGGPFGSI